MGAMIMMYYHHAFTNTIQMIYNYKLPKYSKALILLISDECDLV